MTIIEKPKTKPGKELRNLERQLDDLRAQGAKSNAALRTAQGELEQLDEALRLARRGVKLGETTANVVAVLERKRERLSAAADPRQNPDHGAVQDAIKEVETRIARHITANYRELAKELVPAEDEVMKDVDTVLAAISKLVDDWRSVADAHGRLLRPIQGVDSRAIPAIDPIATLARAAGDLRDHAGGIPRPAPRGVTLPGEEPQVDRGQIIELEAPRNGPGFEVLA